MSIPGKLKLSTITDECSAEKDFLKNGSEKLEALSSKFKAKFNLKILFNPERHTLLPLETSSPSSKVS